MLSTVILKGITALAVIAFLPLRRYLFVTGHYIRYQAYRLPKLGLPKNFSHAGF